MLLSGSRAQGKCVSALICADKAYRHVKANAFRQRKSAVQAKVLLVGCPVAIDTEREIICSAATHANAEDC